MRGGMESGAGGGGDYSGITPDDPNNLTNLEIEAIRSATYAQQKLDEYYEAYNKTQKGIIEKKDKTLSTLTEEEIGLLNDEELKGIIIQGGLKDNIDEKIKNTFAYLLRKFYNDIPVKKEDVVRLQVMANKLVFILIN